MTATTIAILVGVFICSCTVWPSLVNQATTSLLDQTIENPLVDKRIGYTYRTAVSRIFAQANCPRAHRLGYRPANTIRRAFPLQLLFVCHQFHTCTAQLLCGDVHTKLVLNCLLSSQAERYICKDHRDQNSSTDSPRHTQTDSSPPPAQSGRSAYISPALPDNS